MPVTSRELPPPATPPPLNIGALIILAIIVLLALVSLAAGALSSGAPAAPAATATPAAGATLAPLAVITATPAPEQPTTAPTIAPTLTPNCPVAELPPEGARIGWLARAAGCPEVLWARVNGRGQWTRRPPTLPDAVYSQLPELPVR